MRFSLVSHIAKSLKVPQGSVEQLLGKRGIKPVAKYGFAFVYDADQIDRELQVQVDCLTDDEVVGVVPLDRQPAQRNEE